MVEYPSLMRVRVLFFGVLRDAFAAKEEIVELAGQARVSELLAAIEQRGRAARDLWPSIAVAVNQQYARATDRLSDGDEVALLPPVSGGVCT